MQVFKTFQIIKTFKNKKLLTFTDDNKIKIYIDDNYEKLNIEKGYKMNLIGSNKGSYKGSFMNNYICKKFISNQKLNVVNIETNKILNSCKYFLLSENEYINYFPDNIEYVYYWYLRSSQYDNAFFILVGTDGTADYNWTHGSSGFTPCFYKKED